jgi:hypothetical protein
VLPGSIPVDVRLLDDKLLEPDVCNAVVLGAPDNVSVEVELPPIGLD